MSSEGTSGWSARIKENLPIFIILGVALIVRLWSIGTMSLSNDEMSSLWRSVTQSSWHEVLINGVMTDGHPPLTYILLRCWVHLFGDSAFSIRLPFVLSSVLALYFTYLTGAIWFGRSAALFAVCLLSFTAYDVYLSQIARPYGLGLLWVQAAGYYWSAYFTDTRYKSSMIYLGLWSLMAILSCYTHYFSFMAVGLMGITGLFFISRQLLLPYLLSCFVILLSLLPGYSIFRQQLSYNGLDWLPPPGSNWLGEYLCGTLNNSALLYVAVAFLFITSILICLKAQKSLFKKFQLIGLAWFLISFLVGYFKSLYSKPVLQPSCLFFTYPFVVLSFFSLCPILFGWGFSFVLVR